MRDGFTRAPTGGFGRIGVALCPSATASNALARATWAAGSACERLMRTSQTRSWSVSFRRGSFWRRLIGKPPGEVEELAAYSTFAGIATPMATDPLGLIYKGENVLELRNAGLDHADLSELSLRKAYLVGADLRVSDLSGADLSDSDLTEADLRGADLRRALEV